MHTRSTLRYRISNTLRVCTTRKYRKFKRPLPSYSATQASARKRTPVSIEALWRTDATNRRSGLRSKGPDLDR